MPIPKEYYQRLDWIAYLEKIKWARPNETWEALLDLADDIGRLELELDGKNWEQEKSRIPEDKRGARGSKASSEEGG